jgi:hypothetical protein
LREANMREAAARAQIGMAIADGESMKADSLAVLEWHGEPINSRLGPRAYPLNSGGDRRQSAKAR